MTVTIVQRIAGGFLLLVFLMTIMSVSSHQWLGRIDTQMTTVIEEATPILLLSSNMAVSLLSANKSVMQHLASKDAETMKKQAAALVQQRVRYTADFEQLEQISKNFQAMHDSIMGLDGRANIFFDDAEKVIKINESLVQLNSKLSTAERILLNDLQFLQEDIGEVISSGINEQVVFLAKMLREQYLTLAVDLRAIIRSRKMEELNKLEGSLYIEGYGLKAMKSAQEKLTSLDKDVAAVIGESIAVIENHLTDPAGVVQKHKERVRLMALSDQMIHGLTNTINSTSSQINLLIESAKEQVEIAQFESRESVALSQVTGLIINVFSAVVAIVIGVWVSRSIKVPLAKVMAMLKQISDGDLTQRLPVKGKDEFSHLSGWVNTLADKLEGVIKDLQQASISVSHSTKKAVAVSSRTCEKMDQQLDQTTMIAASIEQMAATASQVAMNAENAQREITGVRKNTERSRVLMDTNIQAVTRLEKGIESANTKITELNNYANDIDHISEEIQGIAVQTNLLALNAAIEAARAGEHGRGFAVVADEVRALAGRTQGSTGEIQEMIEHLQQGIKEAMAKMEVSRKEALSGVEDTVEAGRVVRLIEEQVDQIHNMSLQISTAAEQQTCVNQESARSIQRVADMTKECVGDVKKSAEESQVLLELALGLQAINSQFKLH